MVKVAPSILSADFFNLGEDISWAEQHGADWLHIDVMDGRFVPNISIGSPVLKSISSNSELVMDVHLMIVEPEKHIKDFCDAGADIITIHAEASYHLHRALSMIKEYGLKAGIALNPSTPVHVLDHLWDLVDLVLIMSVNPGYGGQSFIPEILPKIKAVSEKISGLNNHVELGVDGGINITTAPAVVDAGATMLVMGSALFNKQEKDPKAIQAIKMLPTNKGKV